VRRFRKFLLRKTRKGRMNALIDAVLHPYFNNPEAIVIDSLLHLFIEADNPKKYLKKLMKYNLPKLIRALEKYRER